MYDEANRFGSKGCRIYDQKRIFPFKGPASTYIMKMTSAMYPPYLFWRHCSTGYESDLSGAIKKNDLNSIRHAIAGKSDLNIKYEEGSLR